MQSRGQAVVPFVAPVPKAPSCSPLTSWHLFSQGLPLTRRACLQLWLEERRFQLVARYLKAQARFIVSLEKYAEYFAFRSCPETYFADKKGKTGGTSTFESKTLQQQFSFSPDKVRHDFQP